MKLSISNLEFVKDYGDEFESVRLHIRDEGDRTLYRCRKCKGYVLQQYSEIHAPGSVYIDCFPVRDEKHAEEVNREFNGWRIKTDYPYKKIFFSYIYGD